MSITSKVEHPFDWRAHLRVHPAAELFPLMSEAELKELAADIKVKGLRTPIITWSPLGGDHGPILLDGRNRLDALALLGLLYETGDHHVGLRTWTGKKWRDLSGDRIEQDHCHHFHGDDPLALALSLNVHRRHLTPEQKRELIAKVLKAKPDASNREIAKQVKADDKTVGTIRTEMEARAEIPHVEKRTDSKSRKQPARKAETYRGQLIRDAAAAGIKNPQHLSNKVLADALITGSLETTPGAGISAAVNAFTVPAETAEASAEQRKAKYAATSADDNIESNIDPTTPSPEEFWQTSITNMAGEAVSLPAYWHKNFPGWEKFKAPSDIKTLAKQAAAAWTEIASTVSAMADNEEVERDRKECISLYQKVLDAEHERDNASGPSGVDSVDLSIPGFLRRDLPASNAS